MYSTTAPIRQLWLFFRSRVRLFRCRQVFSCLLISLFGTAITSFVRLDNRSIGVFPGTVIFIAAHPSQVTTGHLLPFRSLLPIGPPRRRLTRGRLSTCYWPPSRSVLSVHAEGRRLRTPRPAQYSLPYLN